MAGTPARAHVRTPFPYLENGWLVSAEMWCAVRGPFAMCLTSRGSSARALVRTPFLYLGNCWTDRAEIWCVIEGSLAIHFERNLWVECIWALHLYTHFPILGDSRTDSDLSFP